MIKSLADALYPATDAEVDGLDGKAVLRSLANCSPTDDAPYGTNRGSLPSHLMFGPTQLSCTGPDITGRSGQAFYP